MKLSICVMTQMSVPWLAEQALILFIFDLMTLWRQVMSEAWVWFLETSYNRNIYTLTGKP